MVEKFRTKNPPFQKEDSERGTSKLESWNDKCPIFLGNFTPKTQQPLP